MPLDGASAVVTADALSAAGRRAIGADGAGRRLHRRSRIAGDTSCPDGVALRLPVRLAFEVQPGNVRLRPATPLTIRGATLRAAHGLAPDIEVRMKQAARRTRMKAEAGDRSRSTFRKRAALVRLSRRGGRTQSPDYTVTLLDRRGSDESICRYDFPSFTKMAAATETDGGDIYAPEGSRVT